MRPPVTASAYAPGRVELLGNHTDYNDGVVLAAAIDLGLTVSGATRDDNRIVLESPGLCSPANLDLGDLRPQKGETWVNYILGVVNELRGEGMECQGFQAQVTGTLPPGRGLSSSAALEVATAYFLTELHGFRTTPLSIARLCHRAENRFVGVNSGLLDQLTCTLAEADHALFLDIRTEELRSIPFSSAWSLVITDSGVHHELVAGEYNTRRDECHEAARLLGVPALRDVNVERLNANADSLGPLLFRRASHIVSENDRVMQALDCLANGDGAGFGALMSASHESSRVNFENSTPELDLLVKLAQSMPHVLGSRLTGGGFGGSTVSLVDSAHAESVAAELAQRYSAESGYAASSLVCRPADGAAHQRAPVQS